MLGNYHDTSGNKTTAPNNLRNCHFQFLSGGGNEVVICPNANINALIVKRPSENLSFQTAFFK